VGRAFDCGIEAGKATSHFMSIGRLSKNLRTLRLLFSLKAITLYYTKTHPRQRMSTAISIRIPDELAARLAEIAEETERPKSFHIQKAIESYLSELADLQVALDRLHDATDLVISLKDMRKDLGL
jgi:RHH-type rel operon transcriptional repressor/antitoxin RelB